MKKALFVLAVVASAAAHLTEPATAAVQYWDADGSTLGNDATTGAGLGGTGNWGPSSDPANDLWWNDASNTISAWGQGNDAVFWGEAGTVNLRGSPEANSVTFKTDGYVITALAAARRIEFTGAASITVDSGVEATITANLVATEGLTKHGAGTLIFSPNFTNPPKIDGSFTIADGTLSTETIWQLNEAADTTVTIINGSTFRHTGDGQASLIHFFHGISFGSGGGVLDISNETGEISYGGELSGTGSMTKDGPGTLVVTGNNSSYSGGTTVRGGTLVVDNTSGSATGSGPVTVEGGGTLAGAGIVAGSVTIESGGTLSPGTSIGTLDVGNLSFQAGSTLLYQVDTSASLTAAADLVNVAGDLSIAPGALLNIVDLASTSLLLDIGTKFTLIAYTGTWDGGTFDQHPDDGVFTVGENLFRIAYADATPGVNFSSDVLNTSYVTITAVPETSAFVYGGLVCSMLGLVVAGRAAFRRLRLVRREI